MIGPVECFGGLLFIDRSGALTLALSQGERESGATGWVGQVVVAITTAGPDLLRSCMN